MNIWAPVLYVVALATAGTMAQENQFGSLPQGNYTVDDTVLSGGDGLSTLFSMATGFVNVVFASLTDVADFIQAAVASGDAGYLTSNWQEAAKLEAGFVACLVFGLLFIVLVPFVGSIMCCCRCCCGKCGGRLEQSEKRSKSCYRQCLCVSMLILTTLMAIPTVFVFLTNEWVRDVVNSGPAKTAAALNDLSTYLNVIPTQVTYVTDQYMTVDNNVRPLVADFGKSIGVPLQQYVNETAQNSLVAMDEAIAVVDNTVTAINAVDQSLTVLTTGMATLNTSLTDLQTAMSGGLGSTTCTNDPYCNNVYMSRSQLAIGFIVADLGPLQTELSGANASLTSFDITGQKNQVLKEIDEIPSTVTTQTQGASDSAVSALNSANSSVSSISSNLPSFAQIDSSISNINTSIVNGLQFYNDNIEQYTYIGGVVLGSILAIIVGCYFIGIVLGIFGNDEKLGPAERGCGSNCGGILLMVGVGFSFIFSWLLMILVMVLFTIGGHTERYGCQGLEGPNYELITLLESNLGLNLSQQLGLPPGEELTFKSVLTSCQNDASAYSAFKMEHVYNVSDSLGTVTSELGNMETQINSAVDDIDLSTISVYSEQNQDDLLALQNSGIDAIDFDDYLSKTGNGITQTDLTEYAAFLRASAANFTSTVNTTFYTLVMGYADQVELIQANQVVPMQDDYDSLQANINVLMNTSMDLNMTIISLDDALSALNATIQTQGKNKTSEIVNGVFQQVSGNVTAYTTWVEQQITQELAKCKPFYDSYTALLAVLCDYMIDTINGLWFSLGWAIFFLIPSAIVAMKLMKFYRRMNFQESYDEGNGGYY